MIKRNRYALEYKEKLVREISMGKVTLTEVSKREKVSYQTLQKWMIQFGSGAVGSSSSEVKMLKKKLAECESAMGEMAIELHLLKKMEKFSLELKRRKNSSGVISPSSTV